MYRKKRGVVKVIFKIKYFLFDEPATAIEPVKGSFFIIN
jgi:hypothetical protein